MMSNFVEFGRMFLSYGLLLLIIVAVCSAAIAIGITLAKRKNAKNQLSSQGETAENKA